MLPNTITLAVDLLNNGSPTNEVFVRQEETLNRSTYRGPNHSLVARNILQFYRTAAKRVGNYFGSAKTSAKFTTDVTILGVDGSNVVGPLIVELSVSAPIGVTAAQLKAARQRVIALSDDDTVMDPHMNFQDI